MAERPACHILSSIKAGRDRKNMEEIWKPIKGFESYQISSFGRVKSLEKKTYTKYGNIRKIYPEIILKQNHNTFGYMQVNLGSKGRMKIVHRLVAEAFLDNPNNFPVVNHKNGVKDDNRVENLEWCSVSYNTWHACNILGVFSQPIKCLETGEKWSSIRECSRYVGKGVITAVRKNRPYKGKHYEKILTNQNK